MSLRLIYTPEDIMRSLEGYMRDVGVSGGHIIMVKYKSKYFDNIAIRKERSVIWLVLEELWVMIPPTCATQLIHLLLRSDYSLGEVLDSLDGIVLRIGDPNQTYIACLAYLFGPHNTSYLPDDEWIAHIRWTHVNGDFIRTAVMQTALIQIVPSSDVLYLMLVTTSAWTMWPTNHMRRIVLMLGYNRALEFVSWNLHRTEFKDLAGMIERLLDTRTSTSVHRYLADKEYPAVDDCFKRGPVDIRFRTRHGLFIDLKGYIVRSQESKHRIKDRRYVDEVVTFNEGMFSFKFTPAGVPGVRISSFCMALTYQQPVGPYGVVAFAHSYGDKTRKLEMHAPALDAGDDGKFQDVWLTYFFQGTGNRDEDTQSITVQFSLRYPPDYNPALLMLRYINITTVARDAVMPAPSVGIGWTMCLKPFPRDLKPRCLTRHAYPRCYHIRQPLHEVMGMFVEEYIYSSECKPLKGWPLILPMEVAGVYSTPTVYGSSTPNDAPIWFAWNYPAPMSLHEIVHRAMETGDNIDEHINAFIRRINFWCTFPCRLLPPTPRHVWFSRCVDIERAVTRPATCNITGAFGAVLGNTSAPVSDEWVVPLVRHAPLDDGEKDADARAMRENLRSLIMLLIWALHVDGPEFVLPRTKDAGEFMLAFNEKQIWSNFGWSTTFFESAADAAYGCARNTPSPGDGSNENEILFMALANLRRQLDVGTAVEHPAMFLHWFVLTAKPLDVQVNERCCAS